MKKLIYGNIILIVLFIISFILSFFVVDNLTKLTLLMPIIILFMEAGMFLYTFTRLKKSTLRIIRRVLGIYSLIAITFTIFIKVYTLITGYYFMYYAYSPILIAFVIYPTILWIMICLMTKKSMTNNRGIIAAITGFLTICIISVNIFVMVFGVETMEIVPNPNQENTIYVTESSFMHSWTKEYKQKNILFMESVEDVDPVFE